MRKRTKHDYERRITQLLQHVVDNLDDAITPDELATLANFSRFHFQRLFRAITGETVANLLRRLKLERAAAHLREGQLSVTEIALQAGYESGEAFARAFKRQSGLSPSDYRHAWPPPTLQPRSARVRFRSSDGLIEFEPSSNGGIPMDIRIESRPATHYAFIRHVGPYSEIGPSFERLFGWAGRSGLIGPDTNCFSLSYDDPETVAADALRSDACLSLEKEDIETTGEIKVGTILAGRYAVHRHVGPYDGISAAYRHMFARWLPVSGEAVAERPCMEIYLNNPEATPPGRLETLLCIPLEGQDTV